MTTKTTTKTAKWMAHMEAAWEVPRDILLRRYPPFVTGGELPRGHVPVFVFHSVEADSFGRKLHYLADNGYVPLSIDEYMDVLGGRRTPPERAVLLTFDDGRASLVTAGLPLLQRYGMKAVLFLVPGRVRAENQPATTVGPQEDLVSWSEVETLARSGLVDIESHSLTHARVHIAPRIVSFLTPGDRLGYRAMDVPVIPRDGRDLLAPELPLGTPLLQAEPRLGESLRYREEGVVAEACTREVEAGGGPRFFEAADWERRLRRVAVGIPLRGRVETAEEREASIRRELAQSKQEIESRTGRPVTHLCYPWHVSGPTARRIAAEVGYRTAFCGKVPGVTLTPIGGDPLQIARIGEDYVELLPGRGRADLLSVLRRKWRRRFAPVVR
jgi:peptidoglycan/xylan/chitin deacetylase (PgdA/CDA1 family)